MLLNFWATWCPPCRPTTVVIDREANLLDTIEGILLPEEFEGKIKPMLKQRTQ